ncbi:hypothetical protein E2C01_002962 [Portunus trituberculatus]|uniref:Uncharacterized protein n=1 Tax=Portunus trituberculatus TaxID=210409 RepID=A0A5B7CMQ0_PORTR|nr:hypothetical protein [Portunus trituberculatus]
MQLKQGDCDMEGEAGRLRQGRHARPYGDKTRESIRYLYGYIYPPLLSLSSREALLEETGGWLGTGEEKL